MLHRLLKFLLLLRLELNQERSRNHRMLWKRTGFALIYLTLARKVICKLRLQVIEISSHGFVCSVKLISLLKCLVEFLFRLLAEKTSITTVNIKWIIKDVRAKIFEHCGFFSETFTIERWVRDVRNAKKWRVTDFVLEKTCPEEHLILSKSGFVTRATVAASPKILQLEFWREIFSAKYGLNWPMKRI